MAEFSSSRQLSPDWVFSNSSNVHACNDRAWFTKYTPFQSKAGSIYSSECNIAVAGIGTVCLPVKKAPNRTGPGAHGQLLLQDVLHSPQILCNVIGLPDSFVSRYPNITIDFGRSGKSRGSIKDTRGRNIAYFAPNKKLLQVKLSGPPIGPVLRPVGLEDTLLLVNIEWSEDERARWETYRRARYVSTGGPSDQGYPSEPTQRKPRLHSAQLEAPYTLEEKRWLKVHYGGEFKFLLAYGLSIYEDEDREEGRKIVRMCMAEESPEGQKVVNDLPGSDHDGCPILEDQDGCTDDDGEENIEDHIADYHFDEDVLDWINKNYGNSMTFMFSHGLKFYDDDDCEEAKHIAQAMMAFN